MGATTGAGSRRRGAGTLSQRKGATSIGLSSSVRVGSGIRVESRSQVPPEPGAWPSSPGRYGCWIGEGVQGVDIRLAEGVRTARLAAAELGGVARAAATTGAGTRT